MARDAEHPDFEAIIERIQAHGALCGERARAARRRQDDLEGTCIVQLTGRHPLVLWWAEQHEGSKVMRPPAACEDSVHVQEAWCKGVVARLWDLGIRAFPRCRVD